MTMLCQHHSVLFQILIAEQSVDERKQGSAIVRKHLPV